MDRLASALSPAEAGVLRKLVAVGVVALALGVAGGWVLFEWNEGDKDAVPDWSTCTNPGVGFSIDVPTGWHTDYTAFQEACTHFDPRPFDLSRQGGWAPRALQVFPDAGGDQPRYESRGRAGFEGFIFYHRVVERAGRTFAVRTTYAEGFDYSEWKRIVDRAAGSISATKRRAVRIEGANVIPPQVLPLPVARKRAAIWRAAKRGAYAPVAALVDPAGFKYTFGAPLPGGPAAYWRNHPSDPTPLQILAAILELPYSYDRTSKLYVWPFAFTRRASSLSIDEKVQLAEALGDHFLRQYEQLGSYLGYRAGIDSQGNWVFYVAGD